MSAKRFYPGDRITHAVMGGGWVVGVYDFDGTLYVAFDERNDTVLAHVSDMRHAPLPDARTQAHALEGGDACAPES